MRAKIIGRALWYGLVPSYFYEDSPHYSCGYWRHLMVNLAMAGRWLVGRENDGDREFEGVAVKTPPPPSQ